MCGVTKHHGKTFWCMRCLTHHDSDLRLKLHLKTCSSHNLQTINMPVKGEHFLEFNKYSNKFPTNFVIYSDFESILVNAKRKHIDNNDRKTEKINKHLVCGFSLKLVCTNSKYSLPLITYRYDESCITDSTEKFVIDVFFDKLEEIKKHIINIIDKRKNKTKLTKEEYKDYLEQEMCHVCEKDLGEIPFKVPFAKDGLYVGAICKFCVMSDPFEMTKSNKTNFKTLTNCYSCKRKFTLEPDKVIECCDITNKFRGAAHNKCKLKLRLHDNIKIPVILHNSKNYDTHLIISGYERSKSKITCIPNTSEKYVSFTVDNFKFIDSYQFLQSSMGNLVSNLNKEDFILLTEEFGKNANLMSRKGKYPYTYMSNWSKFKETKLPSINDFYDTLKEEKCKKEDYKHAQNVWNKLECKTMGDYHDIYVKSDVLLLADVFENFRKIAMRYYDLDPCHYYTLPGFSWDSMLKFNKVKLELLLDVDMYKFYEDSIRGGISMIGKRHACAYNKYVEGFVEDDGKKHIFISYDDANNLYGYAMIKKLPCSNFTWMSQKEIDNFD